MDDELRNELQVIATRIKNLDMPQNVSQTKAIAEARKIAAVELHKLGYSHRQIMYALGLKSPQSVSVYLAELQQLTQEDKS